MSKSARKSEWESLEPALRLRIRRVCQISSVWAGLICASATVFYFSKPYMDRRRKEREAALKAQEDDHKLLKT